MERTPTHIKGLHVYLMGVLEHFRGSKVCITRHSCARVRCDTNAASWCGRAPRGTGTPSPRDTRAPAGLPTIISHRRSFRSLLLSAWHVGGGGAVTDENPHVAAAATHEAEHLLRARRRPGLCAARHCAACCEAQGISLLFLEPRATLRRFFWIPQSAQREGEHVHHVERTTSMRENHF